MSLKSIWDCVIEKIEQRLVSWKMMYLSKGDRITLIKSTLFKLSTYFMSLFPLPVGVANHMRGFNEISYGGLGSEFSPGKLVQGLLFIL
jgi:hypothetical protein